VSLALVIAAGDSDGENNRAATVGRSKASKPTFRGTCPWLIADAAKGELGDQRVDGAVVDYGVTGLDRA
jgi:hypothetical protein